jgi:hypothetical protein
MPAHHCNIVQPTFLPAKIILFYSPHLREYIAHIFVSNGAVIIDLYTIYYASASKLSVLMLLPRYATSLRLFTQNYILFYSAHLRDSIEHVFVSNSAVFVELYTIYYSSTFLTIKFVHFEKKSRCALSTANCCKLNFSP